MHSELFSLAWPVPELRSVFLEAPRESGASLASAVLLVVVVVLVVLQVQPFLNNFGTTEPILKIQSVLESFHQLIMLLTKY